MAISQDINEREHGKFREISGLPAVAVVNSDGTPVSDGAATSVKQDSQISLQTTLNTLIETLQELVQRLAPLAGAVASTAQLRTIGVVSGSVTATGGGYITSAQSITEKALAGVSYPEKVAITNLAAVHSNINNVTIS